MNVLYIVLMLAAPCTCPTSSCPEKNFIFGTVPPTQVNGNIVLGLNAQGNLSSNLLVEKGSEIHAASDGGIWIAGEPLTITPPHQCGTESIDFTASKDAAEKSLELGARVFGVSTFPLKVSELKREATTTYSVKSEAVKVSQEKNE